jgi:hypothetical protein
MGSRRRNSTTRLGSLPGASRTGEATAAKPAQLTVIATGNVVCEGRAFVRRHLPFRDGQERRKISADAISPPREPKVRTPKTPV